MFLWELIYVHGFKFDNEHTEWNTWYISMELLIEISMYN